MTTTRPVDNRCFDPTRPHGIRPRRRTDCSLDWGSGQADCSFDRGGRGRIALSIGESAGGLLFRSGEGRTECSFDCGWGRGSIDWRDGATADDLRRGRGRGRRAVDGVAGVRAPRPRQRARRRHGSSPPRRLSATARPPCPASSRAGTRTLALVVTDITNPFYGDIIRGAHEAAGELGLHPPALAHPGGRPARAGVDRAGAAGRRGRAADELPDVGPGDPDDGQAETGHRPQPSATRGAEHPRRQRPRHPTRRRAPDRARPRLDHLRRRPRVELDRRGSLAGPARGDATSSTSGCAGSARATAPTVQAGFGARERDRSPSGPTAVIAYNDVVAIGVIKGLRRLGAARPGRRQHRRLRQHRSSRRSSSRS